MCTTFEWPQSQAAWRAVPDGCCVLVWLTSAPWCRSWETTDVWPCWAAAWRAQPEGEVGVAPESRRAWTMATVPSLAAAVRALPNLVDVS